MKYRFKSISDFAAANCRDLASFEPALWHPAFRRAEVLLSRLSFAELEAERLNARATCSPFAAAMVDREVNRRKRLSAWG